MISLTVNGTPRTGKVTGQSLLFVLRDQLGLLGTKNACEQGECGSCSVWLDGVVVNACLVADGQAHGREVVTIEGVSPDDGPSPVQRAFIDAGAVQCGFCTPGMIMTVQALLERNPDPGADEIRYAIEGNLCRCTGYQAIVDAVRRAAMARGEENSGSSRDERQ